MKNKGFTLTELLIAIAIIAVMAATAVPVISSVTRKSRFSSDMTKAKSMEAGIYEWMSTEYFDDYFIRRNMYNVTNSGIIGNARLGTKTEQIYSYDYAGTNQLPGVEFSDESQIRHAAIVAIKCTDSVKIVIKNNEQFVEGPETASNYGFKYYYKIGRVNPEKDDSNISPLGEDDIYKYYVWLDRPGGVIDSSITTKRLKDEDDYIGTTEMLYSFSFDYGSRDIDDFKVEISQQGNIYYSFDAVPETPAIFKPGIYDIRLYENGDLSSEIKNYTFSGNDTILI